MRAAQPSARALRTTGSAGTARTLPAAQKRTNPYVFIVGCQRSGTTLLQRLLDTHPEIAIIHETRWIIRFFDHRKGLTPEGMVTSRLISRLISHPHFGPMGIDPEVVERLTSGAPPMSYAGFVRVLFNWYGARVGKTLVGDKTPRYVLNIPTLHALWPAARFIHQIRDGRDVCLSVMDWAVTPRIFRRFSTWTEDPISTVAAWWCWQVLCGCQSGRALEAALYREVRYEALVSRPSEECASLCTFLGLAYDERMLRYHEGRTRTDPGLEAKQAWLPVTAGLRDWRTQMPVDAIERFEAVAGELLDQLGYPRAVLHLSQAKLAHAARVRELFRQDMKSRGDVVPARWSGG